MVKVVKLLTGETVIAGVNMVDGKMVLVNPLQPHIRRKQATEEQVANNEQPGVEFNLVPLDTVMFLGTDGIHKVTLESSPSWTAEAEDFPLLLQAWEELDKTVGEQ